MAISSVVGAQSIIKPGVCTSSTRPASPYDGQMIYETDTDRTLVYNGTAWIGVGRMRNIAAFTSSGTWTVPTGVTYAVANIRGAGGGVGTASSGTGGTSSVAFAGGTVSAVGGAGINAYSGAIGNSQAGAANSGNGATFFAYSSGSFFGEGGGKAQDGAFIVAGGAVTPAASITITVGTGGTAGTNGAAGGSGYVYIEYEV